MTEPIDFTKKTFCVVTGASQGIGQTIAVEIAKKLKSKSVFLLLARNEAGLDSTKEKIKAENNDVDVFVKSIDLTRPEKSQLESAVTQSFEGLSKDDIETAILVHNVGSVGDVSKQTVELDDLKTWEDYFALNVCSVAVSNSVFINKLSNYNAKLIVVNITSLCGQKPFKNMACYGSGKAAREMYFKVLAEEKPDITVLNYSPGPVDTAMLANIANDIGDSEMKAMFSDLVEKKTYLSAAQTISKMIDVLEKGSFKSGDTVDYYDRA